MTEAITTDVILDRLKELVEAKVPIPREKWLDAAFSLTVLRMDEATLYNAMHQELAKKKVAIIEAQEKKNVTMAEAKIEALDEFKSLKDQEDKIYTIDELIRIAKKSADINW